MYLRGHYCSPAYEEAPDGRSHYRNPPVKNKAVDKVRRAIGFPTSMPIEFEDFNHFQIQVPLAKWRKCNAIHNWIVQNCADGKDKNQEEIYLDTHTLETLARCIEQIFLAPDAVRQSIAEELIPTTSGFFFGDTSYDEWYYETLKYTLKRIKLIIKYQEEQIAKKNGRPFDNIVYEASW